jgi:hypothetical protein
MHCSAVHCFRVEFFPICGDYEITDKLTDALRIPHLQWRTEEFFWGVAGLRQEFFSGVQQIQLRTEGRENGDLGAIAS